MAEQRLTIGTVASLTGLTVKALRHYDDLGLLEPAHVDERTGYRQYSTEQVKMAALIASLRSVDMPLPDIALALGSTTDRQRQLDLHRERLLEQRMQIDHYLDRIDRLQEMLMTEVQIRTFPETSIHRVSKQLDENSQMSWPSLPDGGALLSWGETNDEQVTVHFAVEDPEVPNDTMRAFEAAVVRTSDPEDIPATLAAALTWLEDHNRDIARPPVERLLPTGPDRADIEIWLPLAEPGSPGLGDLTIQPIEVAADRPASA